MEWIARCIYLPSGLLDRKWQQIMDVSQPQPAAGYRAYGHSSAPAGHPGLYSPHSPYMPPGYVEHQGTAEAYPGYSGYPGYPGYPGEHGGYSHSAQGYPSPSHSAQHYSGHSPQTNFAAYPGYAPGHTPPSGYPQSGYQVPHRPSGGYQLTKPTKKRVPQGSKPLKKPMFNGKAAGGKKVSMKGFSTVSPSCLALAPPPSRQIVKIGAKLAKAELSNCYSWALGDSYWFSGALVFVCQRQNVCS